MLNLSEYQEDLLDRLENQIVSCQDQELVELLRVRKDLLDLFLIQNQLIKDF